MGDDVAPRTSWKDHVWTLGIGLGIALAGAVGSIFGPDIHGFLIPNQQVSASFVTPADGYQLSGQEMTATIHTAHYSGSPETLWVVVRTPFKNRWFPVEFLPHVPNDQDQRISLPIGSTTDQGNFQVFLYLAPDSAENVLSDFVDSANKPGGSGWQVGLSDLPQGLTRMAAVTVYRAQ